jgi:RsiW-degrading membrane proteinase PrsW (M82 family)
MFYFYLNPVLIAAAVLPALVLLVYVYRRDKLDKEPPALLLSLVLLGVLATFCAMVTEELGGLLLSGFVSENSVLYQFLFYFIVVAWSEEGFKYLLLKRRTWRAAAFNCQFDGVVYAVFVSLGFAIWENIWYVIRSGFGTAMLRAVTAIPGHACFGVFMGVWYGAAKRCEHMGRHAKSKLYRWMAVLLPALMHGCYDTIASAEQTGFGWIFVGFILVMFLIAWLLTRRMSAHDRAFVQDDPMPWEDQGGY